MNKFLENDIENIIKKSPETSLSLVVINKEKTEYFNFGEAKQTSSFPVASLTKPIVSIAFLELLDKNNIDINTEIKDFRIEFLNKNFTHLTLKHLLTHRSGFRNSGKLFLNNNTLSLHNFITELDSRPIGEPGDFAYSNNNYNILRFIIQKITNEPFEDFLHNFLNKINMNSSFFSYTVSKEFANSDNEKIKGHLYNLDEKLVEIEKYPDNPINSPSFNLISTAEDMGNFLNYILNKNLKSSFLISEPVYKNTIFESATTLSFNYENTPSGVFLDHNGLLATGFQSYIRIIPEKDFAFCILANDLSVEIQLISDILTLKYTDGEYKHKFNPPLNNTIPQSILENFPIGFYYGYESGITEFFIEGNKLYLNIFEQDYLLKYYEGNKFYFYEDGFLIEIVINFENNKIYLNSEALLKTQKPQFINKSKMARKLEGIYKHKEEILPDIEIFKDYDEELVKIFLADSMEEFEIFLLDTENEVILPDYGHLLLKYDSDNNIKGFELDGFEEYVKI